MKNFEMTEIEKVTNNQAKARSIYNSLIKDNIFYTGISKNLAIALIELGIDSSTTYKLSVEKLQSDNETLKKALTNIKLRTERDELETYYVERNHDIRKDAIDALAAIGNEGSGDE